MILLFNSLEKTNEKRNTAISQMRLGSVFRMRMSILNIATTEQMGYGSISFFCVLAPEGMNTISLWEGDGEEDGRLWLILILSPQCCHADKMISPAIIVYDKFTTILWQYIIFFFWMIYLSSK